MSNFDPDLFMSQETDTVNETDYTPIPEGEYQAVIKKLESNITSTGKPVLNITWLIDDEEVRQFTGMPEPTCRQSIWLDIDDNGRLEAGANKNIGLGRLRSALGQNDGKPWSPTMMEGQVAMVAIKHTPAKDDPGTIYANVAQVTAA